MPPIPFKRGPIRGPLQRRWERRDASSVAIAPSTLLLSLGSGVGALAGSQKFTGTGAALTSVTVRARALNPIGIGTVVLDIYAAGAGGLPTGSPIVSSGDSHVDSDWDSVVVSEIAFSITAFTPTLGTDYCYVVTYDDFSFGGEFGLEYTIPASDGGWYDGVWHELNGNLTSFATFASGSHEIDPAGFANTQAFGTVGVNGTIAPDGFANTQAFGTVGVGGTIAPVGFANAQAFGNAEVRATIAATGFANAQAFGTVGVNGTIQPVGFANSQSFGSVGVNGTIRPDGFVNAQSFGVPTIGSAQRVVVGGSAFRRRPVEQAPFVFIPPHIIKPVGFQNVSTFGTPEVQHSNVIALRRNQRTARQLSQLAGLRLAA